MNTIRLLLKEALQAHVTAFSPDAPTGWDITVRFMRLGRHKFERKIWRQTTLDEFYDLEVGEPLQTTRNTISYTVNPRFVDEENIEELYQELLRDLEKVA
tara:strand:- start:28 stop:327 length:300 start_codon:yes stop_codon:yes gene_type:complete